MRAYDPGKTAGVCLEHVFNCNFSSIHADPVYLSLKATKSEVFIRKQSERIISDCKDDIYCTHSMHIESLSYGHRVQCQTVSFGRKDSAIKQSRSS